MMRVKRLHSKATLPAYATDGAAGLDLHVVEDHLLGAEWTKLPVGIAVQIPPGHEGQIRPRSSATLKGIDVALGTIDSDYRGPIAILARSTQGARFVHCGDRIAQLVIAPVARVEVLEGELSDTERGECGFGSTGR